MNGAWCSESSNFSEFLYSSVAYTRVILTKVNCFRAGLGAGLLQSGFSLIVITVMGHFACVAKWGESKTEMRGGRGGGTKETLARKPQDSAERRSPTLIWFYMLFPGF